MFLCVTPPIYCVFLTVSHAQFSQDRLWVHLSADQDKALDDEVLITWIDTKEEST